jgi:hypothetical protein
MKTLRVILIAMTAPALLLLGLHQIGSTPLSKGYATGFAWRADPAHGELILSAQPDGSMTCWIKLKVPINQGKVTAKTEGGAPLLVKTTPANLHDEWLEITKSATEDFFEWPSGRRVIVQFVPEPHTLTIDDWLAYLNNRSPDSKSWSRWRRVLFIFGFVLLFAAIVGSVLQVLEARRAKKPSFAPQNCVEQMIASFEGRNADESDQNRMFLRKLLLEEASIEEAMAPLNLSRRRQVEFLARINAPFRFRLDSHVDYLKRLSSRLSLPQ